MKCRGRVVSANEKRKDKVEKLVAANVNKADIFTVRQVLCSYDTSSLLILPLLLPFSSNWTDQRRCTSVVATISVTAAAVVNEPAITRPICVYVCVYRIETKIIDAFG